MSFSRQTSILMVFFTTALLLAVTSAYLSHAGVAVTILSPSELVDTWADQSSSPCLCSTNNTLCGTSYVTTIMGTDYCCYCSGDKTIGKPSINPRTVCCTDPMGQGCSYDSKANLPCPNQYLWCGAPQNPGNCNTCAVIGGKLMGGCNSIFSAKGTACPKPNLDCP